MNIFQMNSYYLPYPGGQERFIHNLNKYLLQNNVDIMVTCSGEMNTRFKLDNVNIIKYKSSITLFNNPVVFNWLFMESGIKKCDLIHVHNEFSFAAIAGLFLSIKWKKPLIVTNHGNLVNKNKLINIIINIYYNTVCKYIFKKCDHITVLSNNDKERIVNKFHIDANKITTIPNSIDTDYWGNIEKNEKFKSYLNNNYNILYVGRLIVRKGLDWLLTAITKDQNLKNNSDIQLLIVGEGEDYEYFAELADNLNINWSIKFLHTVSDEQLAYLYNNSNIYILPSLSEGLPTTILESLYFDLSVISTKIPSIVEHLEGYVTFIQYGDDDGLCRSINKALSDPSKNNSNKLINDRFSWRKNSKMFISVYERVINERKN